MTKYFFHCFIKGYVEPDGYRVNDAIGAMEVERWQIFNDRIEVHLPKPAGFPRGMRHFFMFDSGNRLYLLENHGQCQEPNGDIIWRCEDGAFGDEEVRCVDGLAA